MYWVPLYTCPYHACVVCDHQYHSVSFRTSLGLIGSVIQRGLFILGHFVGKIIKVTVTRSSLRGLAISTHMVFTSVIRCFITSQGNADDFSSLNIFNITEQLHLLFVGRHVKQVTTCKLLCLNIKSMIKNALCFSLKTTRFDNKWVCFLREEEVV